MIIYWILRLLLSIGFRAEVYIIAQNLDSSETFEVVPEAATIGRKLQKHLIRKGFLECQYCQGAMARPDEHLEDPDGYCAQEATMTAMMV